MKDFEIDFGGQLDRLVDGELSAADRRELLIAVEREDGWRRVALAFLESQAVRDALRREASSATAVSSTAIATAVMPVSVNRPIPVGQQGRWLRGLTLAACCAMMFVMGRLSQLPHRQDVAGPEVAGPDVVSPATYQSEVAQDQSALPVQVADTSAPVTQQTLRLELGDARGGPTQAVEVPMVEDSAIDAQELLNSPSVIPESTLRALLKSGRRVYEQRQLYEVTLDDGRHGVVPVSDVMVENAGLDVFQ